MLKLMLFKLDLVPWQKDWVLVKVIVKHKKMNINIVSRIFRATMFK